MPGKKKKNASEGVGVVAAVTKAGKFTFGNAKDVASDTSSSSVQSPEIQPVATPSTNGHSTTSPNLEPISASSVGPIATGAAMPPRANEWPRSIPQVAGSPGNLISLMGESPPTQPSSYEDPRQFHSNWSSPRPQIHTPPFASASPPVTSRRPHSLQLGSHYTPSEAPSHDVSPATKRNSLHAHTMNARGHPNPPLPHQPQAHYYGLPDIDFDLQPQSGMKAGERGYHFGFDSLPTPGASNISDANTVITAGYEGGMEVYSVSTRGLESLASLKGLRGGIYRAKILPWFSSGPGSELFPLVAVVIHGPVLRSASSDTTVHGDYDGQGERPTGSPVPPMDLGTRDGLYPKAVFPVEFYQTSVEVYSLKTGGLVEVLLEAPPIQLTKPITNPLFQAPAPSGALYLKADAGNLVVSSGNSGESWVFRQVIQHQQPTVQFRCLGKLWTTLQLPPKVDGTQEVDRDRLSAPKQPIFALNGRWIAYCPAAPSSRNMLKASVRVEAQGRAPGLSSKAPPHLPPVNADADLPLSESVMNRIMRDATQELISGAKWVGQQGWQAFNNYWRGASTPQPPRSPPLGSQPWGSPYPARTDLAQFPPTHGAMAPAVSKEPGIVSIVDIETLAASSSVHPIATFSTSLGCSFLSFSPSGLSLFTASTKGDVQTVWDLMRIQHTKASPLQPSAAPGTPSGPRVRQIAQFSRLTVARVVDVAWTRPHGERLAMVTERGTVHLLDLPSSAFTWPPPRRRTRMQDQAGTGESPASAYAYASNALSSAVDVARPLLTRQRRSSANIPQSAGATIVDHASQGGKMIAAGISHSLGKTSNAISQLRHTGDNRVALPPSSGTPGPSCVMWVSRKRHHSLFVLGDGLVRTFPTKILKSSSGAELGRTPRLNRYKDLKVPGLPADTVAAAVKRFLEPDEYLDLTDPGDGGNTMILDKAPKVTPQESFAQSSIPQAEIESSAPYQPFHTDRRVALYEVSSEPGSGAHQTPAATDLLGDLDLEDRPMTPSSRRKPSKKAAVPKMEAKPAADGAWVFGQAIAATKLDTGVPPLSEEESLKMSTDDMRALPPSAMERVLQHVGHNDEQIVVTTRRRRRGDRSAEHEGDGFFEDDCEVLDFADQRV